MRGYVARGRPQSQTWIDQITGVWIERRCPGSTTLLTPESLLSCLVALQAQVRHTLSKSLQPSLGGSHMSSARTRAAARARATRGPRARGRRYEAAAAQPSASRRRAAAGRPRDGQWDVVKCLIEHGVDPKSLAGADALVYASAQCRWDLVKWLVQLGVRRHVPWAVCRRRASKQQHPSVISNRGGGT